MTNEREQQANDAATDQLIAAQQTDRQISKLRVIKEIESVLKSFSWSMTDEQRQRAVARMVEIAVDEQDVYTTKESIQAFKALLDAQKSEREALDLLLKSINDKIGGAGQVLNVGVKVGDDNETKSRLDSIIAEIRTGRISEQADGQRATGNHRSAEETRVIPVEAERREEKTGQAEEPESG